MSDQQGEEHGGERRAGRWRLRYEPTGAAGAALAARDALRADCANCFGLCCVALPFAASSDFAVDKSAGEPCGNLREDSRCGIHAELRERGFPGCTVFDCFGAGQQVSQVTFAGEDWRSAPGTARRMVEVFPVMRGLHELLWYVTEALELTAGAVAGAGAGAEVPVRARARADSRTRTRIRDRSSLHRDLGRALKEVRKLTRGSAAALAELDVAAVRQEVNALLSATSELVRSRVPGRRKNHRGADLVGARLRGAELRGASLRGARLIAADLRSADLRSADLIGADLRDTDLRSADLTGAIFLTQSQVNAARGDAATRLPGAFARPEHWQRAG